MLDCYIIEYRSFSIFIGRAQSTFGWAWALPGPPLAMPLYEGNGIVCQPDITVENTEAACQTDKDLRELTVLQRKEFSELKTENSKLTKELGCN